MNKEENQSVGFSCYDTIYLKFDYIGEEEFDDLIEYIESEHISCEGATDIVYDLKKENQQLQKRIELLNQCIKTDKDKIDYWVDKYEELQQRTEKAIKYIENTYIGSILEVHCGEEEEYTTPLLKILKGEEK